MEHGSHTPAGTTAAAIAVPGLSIAQDGYQLRDVRAPAVTGVDGRLSFKLTGPGGAPVAEYTTAHDRELHLIVVRSDGAEFRHVHPSYDGNGSWSIPWTWSEAGTYRVFADFVPTDLGDTLTLTTTVSVAGELNPRPLPQDSTVATIGDLTVTLVGQVAAQAHSDLTFTVSRAGRPVTDLEPYLGAYGHLVALREGDLAYLHVHPMGEPGDGITQPGPDIAFMATTPTDGKYFLYLDFQVDGQVHTAEFAVTAAPASEQHKTAHHIAAHHSTSHHITAPSHH